MSLTKEQETILHYADISGVRPIPKLLPKVPGFHWCAEYDYLPICDDSPEKENCLCDLTG